MPRPGEPPPSAEGLIESACDSWTSCTYSTFYERVEEGALSDNQWKVFCADMGDAFASVARLPTNLSSVAADNSAWFRSQSHASTSVSGRRLTQALDSVSPGLPSMTAAWTVMTVLWQAWCHVASRGGASGKYAGVVAQITKPGMQEAVDDVRRSLNEGLKLGLTTEIEASKAVFKSTLRLISACLDSATQTGNDAAAVVCSCGRPGHMQKHCTFKSQLI